MADALSEKTGQDLAKALKSLTESINKGGLNNKPSGGETSKNQVETEQKINSILAKRLKDNQKYNDILGKIEKNSQKIIKVDREEKKLQDAELKYLEKVKKLNELLENKARTRTKLHDEQIANLKDEVVFSLKNLDILKQEVLLEKEKAQIEAQVRKDNAKAIEKEEAKEKKREENKIKNRERFKAIVENTSDFLIRQSKSILNYTLDADSAVSKLSANYALSKNESGALKLNIADIVKQTQRIGVGTEDLTKLQTSYTDEIGRSVILSKDGMLAMSETSVALGLGVEATGKMAGNMNLFGLGVKDSMNIFAEMTELSRRSGVSASVTAKKFENNLKIANTYNFKNGVEGVKQMTVEATKLGIKMESVAALADKVSSPEGAIETAAKLQVLGGSFAQMADPMMLLNQGITDMEGLTKTYSKMLDNVISVNSKTGEINENGYEKIRAKAFAEAAGIPFDDVMNTARTKAVRGVITNQLEVNTNIKDEDKDLIASLATFDKNLGAYTVNVRGTQKTINKLDKTDLEYLKPDDVKMSDIAINTLGIKEIVENGFKMILANFSEKLMPLLIELSKAAIDFFNWLMPKIDAIAATVTGKASSGVGSIMSGIGSGGAFSKLGLFGKLGAAGRAASSGMPLIGAGISAVGEYNESGNAKRGIGAGLGSLGGGLLGGAAGSTLIGGLAAAGLMSGVGTIPTLAIMGLAGLGAWAGSKYGADLMGGQKSINDGIISKDGKVTRINDNDSVLAFKPGGQIDRNGILPSPSQKIFQGISQPSYGGGNSVDIGVGKIDVSGVITLNVNGGGSASINASDLIHNQQFMKLFARKLSAQLNRDVNGGKQSTILGPDAI